MIKAGAIYTHYKTGNKYEVLHLAESSEDREALVIYKDLECGEIWARPTSMWGEEITPEKRTEFGQEVRFKILEEPKSYLSIIDGKIYDTSKAKLVKTYYRFIPYTRTNIFGGEGNYRASRECVIYKTAKGNWFEHRKNCKEVGEQEEIVIVKEEEVKETLLEIGDVLNYEKYFEELEEA